MGKTYDIFVTPELLDEIRGWEDKMVPDPKCTICKGTGTITLLLSSCDCDCIQPNSLKNSDYEDEIIPSEPPIGMIPTRICTGCHQARIGQTCNICHGWVCLYCGPGGQCSQCYLKSVFGG